MNHPFIPSKLNVIVCATCNRNMIAHTSSATCEACSNIGKCDVVNGILLCISCFEKELESASDNSSSHALHSSTSGNTSPNNTKTLDYNEKPSDVINNIARSIQADLPANGSEFYNAKVLAIVELEKKIYSDDTIATDNKAFFFAQQIQLRQQILYKTLVEVRELVTEIESEKHANFRAINALAVRLKKEEREKLNIKYAEYIPSKIVGKVRVPRLKAEEKVIIDMAKLMFAPRKDGIIQWEALEAPERQSYIEKAKQYFKGNLK